MSKITFESFLQRKSEEYAHNEILAFLVVILGTVILMGGLLVTIMSVDQPRWLMLFPFPYEITSHPGALGLLLTSTGFLLICTGFVAFVYYDRKKSFFIGQLKGSKPVKRNAKTEIRLDRIRKVLEGQQQAEG